VARTACWSFRSGRSLPAGRSSEIGSCSAEVWRGGRGAAAARLARTTRPSADDAAEIARPDFLRSGDTFLATARFD
jgi:hypothetical protein